LDRHQDKCVIAPAEPGAAVWGAEQSIDFQTGEEADDRTREALARNGEHTLDLCRMSWQLKGSITKE
jgi:hypothetical protein